MSTPRTFACPSCKEIINDSMKECRFCGAPVDPAIALGLAEVQEKVNQACSDASYLKTAAFIMFVLLLLDFVPFLPFVGTAFLITFFVVLVLFVRWQIKFSGLLTNDPDYAKARRAKNLAVVLLILAFPLGFFVRPLVQWLLVGW